MLPVDDLLPYAWLVGILSVMLFSVLSLYRLAGPNGRWGNALRSRFLLGVPWGSLVTIVGVLLVYLLVQDGLTNWHRPLRIPFSSWSYLYPTGWFFAPFSHASTSHLYGNLTSALVLAPLAEYIWGHYPRKRGSQSFSSWRTNPWLRAFVLFPLGALVVGLLTSLFAWGPVIGFSGVVFAYAGFALVRYPLVTIVVLVARSAVRTIHQALVDPIVVAQAVPTLSRPSWYGIAVQGHALGLLLGIVAGAALLWYRRDEERPAALRLWIGTLLVGMFLSLWAIWWVRGEGTYVLYRGLGVAAVFALATLVTVAITASDRPLWGDLTRRQLATLVLVIPLLTMGLVAVPLNLMAVSDPTVPENAVTVEDYAVFYAEDVENQMMSVVNVSFYNETTTLTTSGVIVVSEHRYVWFQAYSRSDLAFHGRVTVHLGGLGWRDAVRAERQGWRVVGNDSVYQVWLEHDGERTHTFASEPSTASPLVDGNHVSIVPEDGTFYVEVGNNESVERAPLPAVNETVDVGELTIHRDGDDLLASVDRTEVRVAVRETTRSVD